MKSKPNDRVAALILEIKTNFSSFRKREQVNKRGKVRSYPQYLRNDCLRALKLGSTATAVAAASGVSRGCLERWKREQEMSPIRRPQPPLPSPIKILEVQKSPVADFQPLVLSIQGLRLEIRREG